MQTVSKHLTPAILREARARLVSGRNSYICNAVAFSAIDAGLDGSEARAECMVALHRLGICIGGRFVSSILQNDLGLDPNTGVGEGREGLVARLVVMNIMIALAQQGAL